MENRMNRWQNSRRHTDEQLEIARVILAKIRAGEPTQKTIRSHPLAHGGYVSKHNLVSVYRQLVRDGITPEDPGLLARIRMKPTRSLSGVSTVTVLTEPLPARAMPVLPDDEIEILFKETRRRACQRTILTRAFRSVRDYYNAHPTDKINFDPGGSGRLPGIAHVVRQRCLTP
jgi:elongator complex protein 3